MSHFDDDKYKHLPQAFRRRMAAQQETPNDENPSDLTTDDDELPQADDQTETDLPDNETGEPQELDEITKLRNDLNSSNGRLRKLEEENARLRIQAENGSFVAQKLLELQAQQKQQPETTEPQNQNHDDAELAELIDELGEVAGKTIWQTRQEAKAAHEQLAQLQSQQQTEKINAKREQFSRAVAAQIPEIQTLLGDENFQAFLQSKKSFDGTSALQFVAAVPDNLDVEKIPQVRALIDEYHNQHAQPKQRKPSAPPTRKAGGETQENTTAKRPMNAKEKAHLAKLMRKPNAKAEIAAFKAKFLKE